MVPFCQKNPVLSDDESLIFHLVNEIWFSEEDLSLDVIK